MSEIASLQRATRPLAWAQAGRWATIMTIGYCGAILCARVVVTARLGGEIFAPFTLKLLGAAVATGFLSVPVLAVMARGPTASHYVRLGLQWGAITVLGLGLVLASGAAWNDASLELLAQYVAGDVATQSPSQGVR